MGKKRSGYRIAVWGATLTAAIFIMSLAGCGQPFPPLTPLPTNTPQVLSAGVIASIDAIAEAALQEAPLAGLTLAVRVGSDPLYVGSYGFSDITAARPTEDDTVYQIGSITKMFTAAAIMQLVERGKVGLDDPISDLIPNLPDSTHAILVRHLLSHTSGLPNLGGAASRIDYSRQYTPDEVIALHFDDFSGPDFAPGSRYRYSNLGYFLLGAVIENVSGLPYGEYLEQNILDPLGLTSTTYCATPPAGMAQGYRVSREKLQPVESSNMSMAYAAGGLCSTAPDLIAWQRGLAGGRAVSPDSYRQMITPVTFPDGSQSSYGYGVAVGEHLGGFALGHDGRTLGFDSMLIHFPGDDVTIAVLANTNPSQPETIATLVSAIAGVCRRRLVTPRRLRKVDFRPGFCYTGRTSKRLRSAPGRASVSVGARVKVTLALRKE